MILTSTIYGVSIRKVSIVIKLESRGIYREISVCTIYVSRAASYGRLKLSDLITEEKESISFCFNRSRDTAYRNILFVLHSICTTLIRDFFSDNVVFLSSRINAILCSLHRN